MRSILVTVLIFGSLPLIIVKPHLGVLVWSWLGYMNPHRLTWGFAFHFSFAMVVGFVTIAAWLFSREPKTLPWHPLVLLLVAFAAWVSFTTLFADYPDHAQEKWDRTIKILLFNGFVTVGLITTRQRLDALIWVIVLSLGFFEGRGVHSADRRQFSPVWTARKLSRRQCRVWPRALDGRPAGPILTDDGDDALDASEPAAVDPLLSGGGSGHVLARRGRGARGHDGGARAQVARHRMRLALVAGLVLAGAVQFMPEHWHARVASIANYGEDASAQGRFQSWRYGLEVVRDSPVVGGGFEVFRGNKVATSVGYRSAHSIYFETLAEHGYVGLTLFLALGIGTYMTAGSIMRRARDHPELAWAANLAAMSQVSIAAYAIAGLFLNLATFDLYYHLIAIVVIASSLVRKAAASEMSAVAIDRAGPFERPSDARA
jgi:O-antigen ligase